ncbi:unnamed protein product [Bursaphelenchus xylophilus]|uniref:(pine wood nematode) hypothetical protein n=1 Tax=Bursaphelenchus xylophilus TaxID=6326 RepID=A0A1I7RJM4_BURXY|nr:unnamed protein product [Bursaphelenchus xylophilus]CAG9128950.1 unnamed protein product [Bursaphelenchus xylophilus]
MDGVRIDDKELSPAYGVTDTGTSSIFAPKDDFVKILKKVKVTKSGTGYLVKCNAKFTLHITVNGKVLHIPANQMLRNVGDKSMCQLMLASADYEFWLLGDPFIRHYCQVHDFAKRRVGFAPVRELAGLE